jgi:hypothetical protein
MRITLRKNSFSFSESVEGKVVIATVSVYGYARVRAAELLRVGATKVLNAFDASEFVCFTEDEFTPVKPKLINCTEIGVGKGWEGFYDQAPVKRSSFRT